MSLLRIAASERWTFYQQIGFFNPIARGQEERLRIQLDRIDHWVGLGAQLSVGFQRA